MTAEKRIPPRQRDPWNKGRMTGRKRPLKPAGGPEARSRDVQSGHRQQARGCDLVRLRVDDVLAGGGVRDRATVIQKKTGRPVQFEITEQARSAIGDWLAAFDTHRSRDLFPSRFRQQPHLSTRQYARIVHRWVERAGPDSSAYGHAFVAANEGGSNLQEDRQLASRAAAARPHQAGEHRSLSRDRGRRCAHHLGAGRALSETAAAVGPGPQHVP